MKNVGMGRLCRFQGSRIASPGMSVRDCLVHVYHHSNLSRRSPADLGKGPSCIMGSNFPLQPGVRDLGFQIYSGTLVTTQRN